MARMLAIRQSKVKIFSVQRGHIAKEIALSRDICYTRLIFALFLSEKRYMRKIRGDELFNEPQTIFVAQMPTQRCQLLIVIKSGFVQYRRFLDSSRKSFS